MRRDGSLTGLLLLRGDGRLRTQGLLRLRGDGSLAGRLLGLLRRDSRLRTQGLLGSGLTGLLGPGCILGCDISAGLFRGAAESLVERLCTRLRSVIEVVVHRINQRLLLRQRAIAAEGDQRFLPQHFLYLRPEPHGQGALRSIFGAALAGATRRGPPALAMA